MAWCRAPGPRVCELACSRRTDHRGFPRRRAARARSVRGRVQRGIPRCRGRRCPRSRPGPDCRGEPSWCGGSVPLRAVLTLLSESGGTVDLRAKKRWHMAGGEPAWLPGVLNAHRHLLDIGPGLVTLRLSLPAVHETVAQTVSQQMAAAISAGKEGTEIGAFRTPTLRLTNRWISVPTLLAAQPKPRWRPMSSRARRRWHFERRLPATRRPGCCRLDLVPGRWPGTSARAWLGGHFSQPFGAQHR